MIFLTVGYELPFDRLVRAVDDWCAERGGGDVFGQIADPGPDGYYPRHFDYTDFVHPDENRRRVREADFIVAHAGMGSIITAIDAVKPILIMPRREAYRETRNDHQFYTAERFGDREGISVAADESEVAASLDRLVATSDQAEVAGGGAFAEDRLIEAVRSAVLGRSAEDP